MDKIIEILSRDGGTRAGEFALTIVLLFGIAALWRAREQTIDQIKKDGPATATIIKESSERLERLADAIEEQDRTRSLMAAAITANSHESQRLRDLIESEGRQNRMVLDEIRRAVEELRSGFKGAK